MRAMPSQDALVAAHGLAAEHLHLAETTAEAAAEEEPLSFGEILEAFQKGVDESVGQDASARYNLGIAYKEMGLLDEACNPLIGARQVGADAQPELPANAGASAGHDAIGLSFGVVFEQTTSRREHPVFGLDPGHPIAVEEMGDEVLTERMNKHSKWRDICYESKMPRK